MSTYRIRETALIMKKGTEEPLGGEPIGCKMVLKSDDQQNEEPRVTVWLSEFHDARDLKVGDTITGDIEKVDSGTPIPGRNGNYINRTLKPEGSVPQPFKGESVPPVDLHELKRRVDILWAERPATVAENQMNTIEYPEEDLGQVPF